MSLAPFTFPDVYIGDKAPVQYGLRVPESKTVTPVYTYGWLVPRAELHEAIYGRPAVLKILLSQVYIGAEDFIWKRWTEKGYQSEYSPHIPLVYQFNSKYVLIYMACNDSDAIIKSIMENETYHEDCRAALNYPKSMKSQPAWIRFLMKHVPEELSADGSVADSNVE